MSTIRVMTFNINGALPEEADPNAWQKRAALNVQTIKRHAPDLIGFQEVVNGNLESYQQPFTEYRHMIGNRYDVEPYAAYTSIFWKPSRFELLEAGEFWFHQCYHISAIIWYS